MKNSEAGSYWGGIVKALGLVFGDIGTSPIYTLTVIVTLTKPSQENIYGIISLIIWTLVVLVMVEYAWLAMSLSRKGEGGTIVLREILVRMIKPGRTMAFVTLLSYVGICLLIGDGVITPAISILSAVEGIELIPGLQDISQNVLILIAALIAVGLFVFQKKGTDTVAKAFGPLMALWFSALTISGIISIVDHVVVLKALNPWYAIHFLYKNGLAGFFVLSEVILCATGGEALYADMGHLGRKPIVRAWHFVFVALVVNYLGQGAYIITHPDARNILFGMVRSEASILYIPFLLLTVVATIIASQALISGVFSIVYQGITTRILPLLKVDYTSKHLKSQVYISSINWALLAAVILIMLLFRKSENLAAAYGLAVTGTMTISGIMMTMIYANTTKKWKVPIAVFVTLADLVFLLANLNKFSHGGYWSLILAAVPFITILVWTKGQRALYRALKPMDFETFEIAYSQIYRKDKNIPGTGLFFVKEWTIIPPYLFHCIIRSNIIYERNVLISIVRTDEPYELKISIKQGLAIGLDAVEVRAGYKEILDIEGILKENNITEKVIFYGIEDIETSNVFWKIFATIKRQTPNFVQFNKLPVARLHGVVTRVEM
ncbi:MAG: KUP/HAK/KT family potassium transporter [Desulfuromonadaceae bacterium]|nr:KUP/HAK/KT family potassium transporter [Desulfuromonadaceae bacterium]MDD2856105.1 KUP/HAK/KT family potassium transporter [Desulfuromonadaceae bacterium]